MLKKLSLRLFLSVIIIFIATSYTVCGQTVPPKYEMRGVWIASVINIDWPSKPGLSTEQQKNEFIQILDKNKSMGINTVFVQVRPSGDAFYPSQYDPWSEYLSGKQGQAPQPYYDPLKFMIDEAHKRGLEFHAWLNPYRMVFDVNKSSVTSNHVTKRHPEWFVRYGKQLIFNPGLPETVNYFVGVVKDIINRYDVDGIHLDDYFYPYPTSQHFNDDAAYRKYGKGLSLADWRRSNCDTAIKRVHEAILATKPMIKFGVSPFGIYKNRSKDPDGSDTRGTTNYHDLYADILLWLKEGWIDYVAPQLYWKIGKEGQDFRVLLDWWKKNTFGRDLYIGQAVYHADERDVSGWAGTNELTNEIKLMRQFPGQVKGSIFFSNKSFSPRTSGFINDLKNDLYRKPALVPPMLWIDKTPPSAPEIWAGNDKNPKVYGLLSERSTREVVTKYVLYTGLTTEHLGEHPEQIIVGDNNGTLFQFTLNNNNIPAGCRKFYVSVTSVDRENNESSESNIIRFEKNNDGTWKGYNGY